MTEVTLRRSAVVLSCWGLVLGVLASSVVLLEDARAASTCKALTIDDPAGVQLRISNLRVSGVSCQRARKVIRSFHSQTIGSSGGTYAAGYGCAYVGRGSVDGAGAKVSCGSGPSGTGPRRISWRARVDR